jgi:tRNA(fMet)-specific endonuclease VapC
MSRLLLDTTYLIDVDRRGIDLDAAIEKDDDVAVAAISIAELLVGVHLATPRHQAARQAYVDDVIDSVPIIPYDIGVAVELAELITAARQAGRPRGAHDLLIAATARSTQRTIVSADDRAFVDLPGVAVRAHG